MIINITNIRNYRTRGKKIKNKLINGMIFCGVWWSTSLQAGLFAVKHSSPCLKYIYIWLKYFPVAWVKRREMTGVLYDPKMSIRLKGQDESIIRPVLFKISARRGL